VFLVKSAYFNLRNNLPKFGTFPRDTLYIYIYIYICVCVCVCVCVFCTFVSPDNKLYKMHGTYIKIIAFLSAHRCVFIFFNFFM